RVYRAALDAYLADPEGYRCAPAWLGELDKVSHRPYGRGFFHGADPQLHRQDSSYRQSHDFVGVVRRVGDDGRGVVEGRNRFFSGDPLELIGPAMRQISFVAGDLAALSGAALAAGQPNQEVSMELPTGARPGDLLRRPKAGKA
ncbi:MAG TPA: U32 family peptidase C-terminal domain-containing protein, partial [Desulfuromonadales bacterium]|nr:U32 family peptidase C-terminal domain-containing protein [Desulfuromonadales bacterium]